MSDGRQAATLSDCWSSDNGRPALTSLTLSAKAVDLSRSNRRVNVRVEAVDSGGPGPASGVQTIWVVAKPDMRPAHGEFAWLASTRLSHKLDGWWQGTIELLRGSPSGRWSVTDVSITDTAGLQRVYFREQLDEGGFRGHFAVVGPTDRRRPRLEGLTLNPGRVDVRRQGDDVAVRARASDDLAVHSVTLWARHPESHDSMVSLRRTGGTARSGIWRGRLHFPRGVASGRWDLKVRLFDNREPGLGQGSQGAGVRTLSRADLAAAGFPGTLRLRSHHDQVRPDVQHVTVSPNVVDTRAGDTAVSVRVSATDVGTGIETASALFFFGYDLGPRASGLRRVSGTGHDGVWEGAFEVPRCQPGGPLRVQVTVTDFAGYNRRAVRRQALLVIADDHRPPLATIRDHTAPPAGPVVVTFDEDVTGISGLSSVIRQGSPYFSPSEEAPKAIPGAWTCDTSAGLATSCTSGAVRVARFTPESPFDPHTSYIVDFNPEHVLDLVDMAGNPGGGQHYFHTTA